MKQQQIGDITVDAIVEAPANAVRLAEFLPASMPEVLQAERAWLQPRFADLDQGIGYLAFHRYLVRTSRHIILVDTCVGNDKQRGGAADFHQLRTAWLDNLRAQGIQPEQVNFVMCTHLHADHVGWNTRLHSGRWIPTFPNARYVFARTEFELRERQFAADHNAGYGMFADSVLPIVESGQSVLVDSDYQLDDQVYFEPAAGHTPGNVVIHLRSRSSAAVLAGDVIHHPIQVMYPEWSAQFCEDPLMSAVCRKRFVETHIESGALVLPAHFPAPTAGRIRRAGCRQRFVFVDD